LLLLSTSRLPLPPEFVVDHQPDDVCGRDTKAARHAADIIVQIERITSCTGITSYGAIANALNESGVRTPRGGRWHPMSVKLVMLRVVKQAGAAA
jgi:hypothetical protein